MGSSVRQRAAGGAAHDARTDVALTAAGWALGLLLTLLVVAVPWVVVAVPSRTAHLVLHTADACIALLAAYLLWGRYLRAGRLSDLLLVQGLVLLAVAGLGLSTVTALLLDAPRGTLDAWVPLALRVMGTCLLALAALPRATRVPTHPVARAWTVAPWVTAALVSATLWLARDILPPAVDTLPPLVGSQTEPVPGHPLLAALHLVTAVLLLLASVGFTARAARDRDELMRWLGPACALGAFARVNYALNPTLYTDWLYAGDVLRTAFHGVLLIGALREVRQYWSGLATEAVLQDRRRLAREIHDGVMQELSYIRSVAHDLRGHHAAADQIREAATRAMDEARAAVHALRRLESEPLAQVLQHAAREVADRHGLTLEADLDPAVETEPDHVHALTRIAREALTNAARHGAASTVHLTLRRDGDARVLSVRDDGGGFASARPETRGGGYGLLTMRERAESLPGTLEVDSQPGQGSVVTVTW
ncbi:sensor histidine kinase [Ornithinimicrobium cavernae]|uniref:sensor histidine kinase n=1 Tax=Ornithinimicrobium cavernae TaxID=2666047 RepID=UPI000D6991D1|nr:sensor histidine kinase [Ornithinimicrobium cavernae]